MHKGILSYRERFEIARFSSQPNEIEIAAITAGSGNGWQFSAEVLRASLALWDGVECFVDHAWPPRSVRDLAGVCAQPRWDDALQGIRVKVTPCGPSASVLESLAQIKNSGATRPRVGFSADLVFSASGDQVTRIEKVYSVDLVAYPARGGGFIQPIFNQPNSINQEVSMESNEVQQVSLASSTLVEERKTPPSAASALPASVDPATATTEDRMSMCACLLEATLSAAHLPAPLENSLRNRFSEGVFQPPALQAAIREARQLVSDLTGGAVIQSAGRISEMSTSEDQISAAMCDLLSAPRPTGLEKLQPARLSGIRELYTLMTGDTAFTGGYHAERAQFSTIINLPSLLKNAMNKLIINQWEELGRSGYRWWEPIVQVEHFNSLQEITGVLVGEVTVLPSVEEGAAYTELAVKDSGETGLWGKYGGYVGLTLEMFERDETHKLRQYPRKLASAALRRISSLVGGIFTANSGTGPEMSDTYAVFEASHHLNLGTAALSSAAWEAAGKAIYDQSLAVASGGTAPKQALDAKYLIVPRDLRLSAMNLLYPSFAHESSIFSENMQKGQMGDVITCPEFSDANDWAAAADPRLAPGIILGERFGVLPEIIIADGETNGALFTNDELRMKVRHWVSVFVADYRPLYKANVA
ncbi:MAG TPA: hypothetical protein DIW44_03925 [Anaerolineaceae bacterium]|nr:hypothetical protein [Anaerolineaceae bacterium]